MASLTPPKPLTPQMQEEVDTLVFRKKRATGMSPVGLLARAPASASPSPPSPLMFNISPRSSRPASRAPAPAPSSPLKLSARSARRSPYMVEALGPEIEYVNRPKAHADKDMEVREHFTHTDLRASCCQTRTLLPSASSSFKLHSNPALCVRCRTTSSSAASSALTSPKLASPMLTMTSTR